MSNPQPPNRRQFLEAGSALGAAVLIGAPAFGAQEKVPRVPRRTLGKTGESIPILLVGGAISLDKRFDPRLAEALRYGVNYIDAADCYTGGNGEVAVGNFMERAKVRDKIWITTKSDEHDPKGMLEVFAKSLERLKTKHVEMLYLHSLKDGASLNAEIARTAEKLKKEGRIKYFGFSCHSSTVAELMQKAAGLSWIDSIMFRYNFLEYGDVALNKAIDACAKANIGLIAMKTQGSAASFESKWQKIEKMGKWTKHQAVLKAVWADERITAAVSHMDSMKKIRQNVAAAVDKEELGAIERDALVRYAAATRSSVCSGCDHLCGAAVDADVRIGDTMRYLMYHDTYGEPERAHGLFGKLPHHAQRIEAVDFGPANAACPHGVDVRAHMARAVEVFRSRPA